MANRGELSCMEATNRRGKSSLQLSLQKRLKLYALIGNVFMNHGDEMTGWIPYSKHENLLQIMYRFGGFSGCLIKTLP